jgi:hypothetical protein
LPDTEKVIEKVAHMHSLLHCTVQYVGLKSKVTPYPKIRANEKILMFIVHLVPQNWQGGALFILFFISEDRFYIHGRGQYHEYCPSDDKSHTSLCNCITQQTYKYIV